MISMTHPFIQSSRNGVMTILSSNIEVSQRVLAHFTCILMVLVEITKNGGRYLANLEN